MFEVRFYVGKQRKTIPLGKKYTQKTAEKLREVVEVLRHYQDNGIEYPGKKTMDWIQSASDEIREKLGKAGLIDVPPSYTLDEVWDSFLEFKATEMKAGKIVVGTYNLYNTIRRRFCHFFDPNGLLCDLTKDQVQKWKDHLLDEVGAATVACYLKETKTCFTWAVGQGWIPKSPLDGIAPGSFRNKDNDHYFPMACYHRLLEACPCNDWRCILALSRIGGLRCPSEVLLLRWEDVNWEYDSVLIRSPKTRRHENGASRLVPLFPELKKELETLFFSPASEGKEFVINRYRDTFQNLRTTLEKIVLRAGLKMFPRPFDNFRASRANEVYRRWGAILEKQWIGHDPSIFEDHYWMTIDTDYQEAAEWTTPTGKVRQSAQNGWKKPGCQGFPPVLPPAQDEISLHGVEGVQVANHR